MTIEEHSKARLHGAKWALDLDVKATVEEIEAARARLHTSITLRADRMSGAPCIGDSRLTVESIARMDRETCRRDFPWVTDEQHAAVKAWIESPYGREWCKADAHHTATLEAQRDRDGAIRERDEARRLHANAVEELARVKMGTITAEQIELFIWRSGWHDEFSATSNEVERFAKSLAQHLRGAP